MSEPNKPKPPRLNVRVDEETLWKLKELAARKRVTLTELLNEWIQKNLKDPEGPAGCTA